ncbi:TPA: ParB-like nuclease domain-containing protein [Klebsiella oxytoca]|uniref:ParB-like nuclease domain-containing protein n=1 Tax=Klebsiella oxytoca TaxID=571 RepID=A0AAN5LDH2_KLEOX|nr:ParB-like nuclease domain-containing protein [Klebsiella oxytoca]
MLPDDITRLLDTWLSGLDATERIAVLNSLHRFLHQYSPFCDEPVDCVQWIPAECITANNYNPNTMSPVEKRLLTLSLLQDGFTQPVVVTPGRTNELRYQVVDGYHRFLLSQGAALRKRLLGHIPVTCIRTGLDEPAGLMAATVRHNRARGQHRVAAMSDIVRDLSRLGWSDSRIGQELGMEQDEVLRLKQISGLTELFASGEYSEAWTVR